MKVPFWAASVNAAPAPIYPTQNPQAKLVNPVMKPDAKILYAFFLATWNISTLSSPYNEALSVFHFQSLGLLESMIDTITP